MKSFLKQYLLSHMYIKVAVVVPPVHRGHKEIPFPLNYRVRESCHYAAFMPRWVRTACLKALEMSSVSQSIE